MIEKTSDEYFKQEINIKFSVNFSCKNLTNNINSRLNDLVSNLVEVQVNTMRKIKNFEFTDVRVFDLANNHQGNFDHGKMIIESLSSVSKSNKIYSGIKFQFRNLGKFYS